MVCANAAQASRLSIFVLSVAFVGRPCLSALQPSTHHVLGADEPDYAHQRTIDSETETLSVEAAGSLVRREPRYHEAVSSLSAVPSRSSERHHRPIASSWGMRAPMRVPARQKVWRVPIQMTSVGHRPTPALRSAKRPPWSSSPKSLHGRQSPTPQRIRDSFHAGEASLREMALAGPRKRPASGKEAGCNPAIETCCNPDDPPQVFEECEANNKDAAAGIAMMGKCTELCENNCCCFFATAVKATWMFLWWSKNWMMKMSVRGMIQMTAFTNVVSTESPEPKANGHEEDVDEYKAYVQDVIADVFKWWGGLMVGCYIIVRLHETFGSYWTRVMNPKAYAAYLDAKRVIEPGDPGEAARHVSKIEQERLGGIVRSLVVELKSINRNMWHLVNFFSLGLFYWIMEKPVQRVIVALGSSGRLMIVETTPVTSMKKAFQVFTAQGVVLMAYIAVWIIWLRVAERGILNARKSPDPDIRRTARQQKDFFTTTVVDNVHLYVLAGFFLTWLVHLVCMKISLRPWAASDKRDYYEAAEANCVQYFRGGTRPCCPCICSRRRGGGMQLFFGPYPTPEIWAASGKDYHGKFLDNLKPEVALPTENNGDNGDGAPPSGGGGKATSEEDDAAAMQTMLGGMNWLLGTLGLCFFGIHLFNLTQNLELCPSSAIISNCVRHGDCTRYVQSGWFQTYIERSGYMSATEAAEQALSGKIGLAHLAMWMNLTSLEEATDAAVMIAKKTCLDRRSELIDGPVSAKNPKSADTLGTFNAKNYNMARVMLRMDIAWDGSTLKCTKCRDATALNYFSNLENSVEVIEVLMLMFTCYVSALLMKMARGKKHNAPIGNVTFDSDPNAAAELDVSSVEKAALAMMADAFMYRYRGGNLPPQARNLEEKMRWATREGFDPLLLADPWTYSPDSVKSWDDYQLCSPSNRRIFLVNKRLLGILAGEEVLSAWSETPRLTLGQKLVLVLGFFFFFVCPCAYGAAIGKPQCFVEGIVGGGTHWFLFHYFVLRRRPQAGFILTTRRIFQLSRTPPYRDMLGKNEPLLKIDVLVHNASFTYVSGMFEGGLSLFRRAMVACCNAPIYRSGSVTLLGGNGVFQLWRDMGDTREIILALSRCAYAEKMPGMSGQWGANLLEDEKKAGVSNKPRDPCYPCILCLCPSTPVPPGAEVRLLKRYCMKFDKEEDVYGRLLSIRPASCGEVCCGKGCDNKECGMLASFVLFSSSLAAALASKGFYREAAFCAFWANLASVAGFASTAVLDENLSDFMITTHRILVEQRGNQRYCRHCLWFMKAIPNTRVTFLSGFTATSYVVDKPGQPYGLCKFRQDFLLKILPEGNRTFPQGLMLRQQPYKIIGKGGGALEDQMWVKHLTMTLDLITQKQDLKELEASSSEESAEDYAEIDYNSPPKKRKPKAKAKGKSRRDPSRHQTARSDSASYADLFRGGDDGGGDDGGGDD